MSLKIACVKTIKLLKLLKWGKDDHPAFFLSITIYGLIIPVFQSFWIFTLKCSSILMFISMQTLNIWGKQNPACTASDDKVRPHRPLHTCTSRKYNTGFNVLYCHSILSDVARGHLQCTIQAGTRQCVDLKRNVQSIDPNPVGLWFLILRPDFSELWL